ncbi:primosomal protein N' (replication factor Y) [Arcanobacterium wilhelmae]|uniref:Primosomal protein N' (Replication factor Y) n=1 Tax=Arcanobacterium wilhelmae TaxID=1803177 RepID=A0ABT9N8J4_9ACTO|nr:hypothetical protein [Arcanobacterium wilhelmae]MDP9800027.1 primosomal protein N' (replication factor Y) [Arcanobacterium wilhelmae]WFN89524.1 hypothetical protein P8A24_04745 [Arcanobacterium wilhelmae]
MNGMDDLFTLGDAQAQEQLLALEPVHRTLTGEVESPVAHVRLDMPQPHMDRIFDYEIPKKFNSVRVGARVVVPVGQRKVDAFIVARDSVTTVAGALRPISRVYSDVPVLSPEVLRLCEQIAARQAAPVSDCLRLAIPQRHARTEKEFDESLAPRFPLRTQKAQMGIWGEYAGGEALFSHLAEGGRYIASVRIAPGHRLIGLISPVIEASLAVGKSALVVVPTPATAHALAQQLSDLGEPVATMVAQSDHAARYQQFLAVRFGHARIVVGTRNAAWAPVENLGCVVMVDEHHSAMREPRSPYVHVREILSTRSELEGCAFIALSYAPSLPLAATRNVDQIVPRVWNHSSAPHILNAADFAFESAPWSRMPSSLFAVVREGLESGPVLVVVPRAGYIPVVACARCRNIAQCTECGGTLGIDSPDAPPRCSTCGQPADPFVCRHCGFTKLRAVRIGSNRTAQEIGRAFRDVPIHFPRVGAPPAPIDSKPRIVVSTPGAEPSLVGGYSAGVIIDSGYLLHSAHLDAHTYFLRSLAHTAARIRTRRDGGKLLIVGNAPRELVQLVDAPWDEWQAEQLRERASLGQPPLSVWCEVTGQWDDLRRFLATLRNRALASGLAMESEVPLEAVLTGGAHGVIPGMSVLGPQPAKGNNLTVFLRFEEADRVQRTALIAAALREVAADHSAPSVRVKVDSML